MNTKSILFILLIIFSQMLVVSTVFKSTKGDSISLSYPQLESVIIDLSDTNIFQSENYYFLITNDGTEKSTVNATAEVLRIDNWELYFKITWNRNSVVLEANESFKFIPRVEINTEFTFNYSLHFVFQSYKDINGTVALVSGIGATGIFEVYSKLVGHTLTVRTTDQGDIEKQSEIDIYYGGNGDVGKGWSIFKSIQDSYYSSIVKEGWYQITAKELDTGFVKTEYHLVNQSKSVNIVFSLVSMTFLFDLPTIQNKNSFNFSYTVSNLYLQLKDVDFVFQIFDSSGNNSITDAKVQNLEVFDKGSYKSGKSLSFDRIWSSGNYSFKGQIWVNGLLYFERVEFFYLSFPFVDDLLQNPLIMPILLIITGFMIANTKSIYRKVKGLKKGDENIIEPEN